jgi:predicted RNA methylase
VNDFQLVNPENPDLCDFSKSQWYLDAALAERIAVWAQGNWPYPKRMRVLEPSAGRGALAVPLRAFFGEVVCCDIDPENAAQLRRLGFQVYEGDFRKLDPGEIEQFDLAVMNPPFEDGATEAHVLHALKFADRVVCHCPLTTLAGKDRREGLWSTAYLKRLVIHASRPKYSGCKTGGATDMCTIDVHARFGRGGDGVRSTGVNVEWWA